MAADFLYNQKPPMLHVNSEKACVKVQEKTMFLKKSTQKWLVLALCLFVPPIIYYWLCNFDPSAQYFLPSISCTAKRLQLKNENTSQWGNVFIIINPQNVRVDGIVGGECNIGYYEGYLLRTSNIRPGETVNYNYADFVDPSGKHLDPKYVKIKYIEIIMTKGSSMHSRDFNLGNVN